MTLYSLPNKSATPSIFNVSEPAPETLAPIAFKQLAKSTISGSRAAFSIVVMPSANAAAIIKFSVPVTLTVSIKMVAPFNRPLLRAMI